MYMHYRIESLNSLTIGAFYKRHIQLLQRCKESLDIWFSKGMLRIQCYWQKEEVHGGKYIYLQSERDNEESGLWKFDTHRILWRQEREREKERQRKTANLCKSIAEQGTEVIKNNVAKKE